MPVDAPDQEVAAGGVVWLVPAVAPAVAGTSASSREDGGSSVVASVAAAVTPAGRPLADASVAYWIP